MLICCIFSVPTAMQGSTWTDTRGRTLVYGRQCRYKPLVFSHQFIQDTQSYKSTGRPPKGKAVWPFFRKVYCSYIYKEWISKQINSYIFHLNCFVILFLIGRWDKIWNCKIPSIRWQSKMKSHWTHIISTVQNINTYWFAIIYSIKQALKKGLLQSLSCSD